MCSILAMIIITVVVAILVAGAVAHPLLYGFFVACAIMLPIVAISSLVDPIVDRILGRRGK